MCLSSETAGQWRPHRTLWCSYMWRTLGKSCRSPSSHSEYSPHWQAYRHKIRATLVTQPNTIHNSVLSMAWDNDNGRRTTTIHRAGESVAGENTDLFFCSSSKLAAFHSEPWNQITKERLSQSHEGQKGKALQSSSLLLSTQISYKEEVEVTWQHPGESTLLSVYWLRHKKGFSPWW